MQAQLTSNNDNPTVTILLKFISPVAETMSCLTVLDLFQKNSDIFALPVVNSDNIPTGLVDRKVFIETFIKPFSKEIHGKKNISAFMNTDSIIVDHSATIDDVARIIVDAGMQHMVSGFIATNDGQYIGVANGLDLLNEITQRKQANLFYLAHYDQLTNLPNRLLFLDRLDMAIIEARRDKTQLGLLFIDLDNFKHFNDSMGHGFGDKLLVATAARLASCARESDTVARLSGDEFTIMQESPTCQDDINALCKRVLEAMTLPLQIMGREVFITASIGTALYPVDDAEPTGLLAKADAAMYEAKRSGRNTYRHFIPGMNVYSLDRMTLETDLRGALERNEFVLFYQPQIELSSGKMIGNEALIRWQHPERGLLSPIHFIEITEETGLIVPIGKWVLQQACRQHMLWIESGLEPMSVSVNISAMQFYQTGFCEMVKSIISDSGIRPIYLELELTESLFMHDVEVVLKTLHTLHDLGVKLAIDDFGTGYSNLGYLKMFPIDKLKIDQSFIRHLECEPVNVDIVKAIAALGKSMSLELVAEGVETDDELDLVISSGCDSVQGYRYSKPLPADQLESWIQKRNQESAISREAAPA
ncbi:MAG: EAL domain-containing protein [Methylococcaceae bacterium]